jgi:hypothetical protein
VTTSPTGDPFGPVYRLMDEIWGAHMEMAELMQNYKTLVEDLEEGVDPDKLRLARSLPGARYSVATTFVREHWLKVEAELGRLFPEDQPSP